MPDHYAILRAALLSLCCCAGVCCCNTVAAQQAELGPRQGVLLLRNGELISGQITRSGDRYDVLVRGSEIRIKTADVELFCRDVLEGYQRRRSTLDLNKVQDHLELAEWCLRNALQGQAAGELKEAIALDASHPKIPLLERRLRLALEQPPVRSAAKPPTEGPAIEDLDRMIRGMPHGAVEAFTSSVQPLLINHCSTSGCHTQQSPSPLKLMRIATGKNASRRATQRNLYSVLKLIDHQRPDESLLLTVPVRAHGTAKAPIFTQHDAQRYKQLVDWVHRVAGEQATPTKPATLDTPDAALLQKVPGGEKEAASSPASTPARPFGQLADEPASGVVQASALGKKEPGRVTVASPLKPNVKRGLTDQTFQPKDAFDPEIFNRRYFGKPSAEDEN